MASSATDHEVARLISALRRIAALHPDKDSKNGWNEWGEAECFEIAQQIAREAIAPAVKPENGDGRIVADDISTQSTYPQNMSMK